jgi:hypothetical protein
VDWTEAEVRGIIGESGSKWCVLEEYTNGNDSNEISSVCSGMSSELGGLQENPNRDADNATGDTDLTQSFIFPELDFSSAFVAPPSPSSLPASDPDILDHSDLDSISDADWDFPPHTAGWWVMKPVGLTGSALQ